MQVLHNPVKGYDWGSATAIPRLLGQEPDGQPIAELWIGAHPASPSRLASGARLDEAVSADPCAHLGEDDAERFDGRLPFLLKVLAAERPLSLQVHPDSGTASARYREEEAAGVPLHAPHRTYKDPHHKPEMIVALEQFDALCGFRDPTQSAELVEALEVPGLAPLRERLLRRDPARALREAFTWAVTLDTRSARALVAELGEAAAALEDAWALEVESVVELAKFYPDDPGVVAATLLNRVRLAPGEALFLPAGNVHAYLSGVGVEIMACSDNVLRGGLTSKHVDVAGLLAVVDFIPTSVPWVVPMQFDGGALVYAPRVDEFALTFFDSPAEVVVPGGRARILLALEGEHVLHAAGRTLTLKSGVAAWVPACDGDVTLTGDGCVVVATSGRG